LQRVLGGVVVVVVDVVVFELFFLFLVKGMFFFFLFGLIVPDRFFKIESLVAAAMAVGQAT
jgi:hypothetical protein